MPTENAISFFGLIIWLIIRIEKLTTKLAEINQPFSSIRSLTIAAYTIRKEGLFNLKIAGELPTYANEFRVGVVKNQPMLRDILNKGISTLKPIEIQEIVNRHISIRVVNPVNYLKILKIVGLLLFALALGGVWAWQLRRLNKRLQESERAKSALLENLPGVAYRCRNDKSWTMEFVSQAFAELTGYKPEDLLYNKTISYSDIMLPHYRDNVRQKLEQSIADRKPFEVEYCIKRADGKIRWVWDRGNALFGSDHSVCGLEGIILDITERKEAENKLRHLEKSESLRRMAESIAHNYNNMLTAVLGNLELAISDTSEDSPAFAEIQASLEAAYSAAEMGKLILCYLGQDADAKCTVDLVEICRQATNEFVTTKFPELKLELPDTPEKITGSPDKLELVLKTIILNAIESLNSDQGIIIMGLEKTSASLIRGDLMFPADFKPETENYYCITISDNGIGIKEEHLKKIFDPFFSTKFTGRGLGLAIALGIISNHSGCITVISKIPGGSEFRVFLPILDDQRCV